jgi:hypothetical protein
MLRSECRASLQPANAAPASMDLVLATAAQCGDSRPGRQGDIDGQAQCDRVHAGAITGAYVVPRERLRRARQARQARSCPMSCLPQARASHRRTWPRESRRGEDEPCPVRRSGSVCKDARPLSHRLVDAGKWFARFWVAEVSCCGPITACEGRSKRHAARLVCRSPACSTTDHPRCGVASSAMHPASRSSPRAPGVKLCWR